MPLENEKLNPIDETNFQDAYANERNRQAGMPNLPINIGNIDPAAFKDSPGEMTIPNPQAIYTETPIGKPGFVATFAHSLMAQNELVNAGKYVASEIENRNHSEDPVPEDFTALSYEAVNGYAQQYWPYLTSAQSPKDLAARQARVSDQMRDEEYYNNGSTVAAVMGGFAGGLTSPSTWLIPMSAGVKYAKFTESFVRNSLKSLPGLAASSVASEGLVEAGKAGGNMQDMAVNTMRDMVFGTAFLGAGAGLSHAMRGGQLWNLRKSMNINHQGIDVNPVISEKGEFKGYKATISKGMIQNAKEVQIAQEYVDRMQMSGAFKIPYMAEIAGNSFLGSPIVKGLTSDYATIRQYTNQMASHGIITEGTTAGIARGDSAEDMLQFTRAKSTFFSTELRGLFFEANGIVGGLNAKNAIKNFKQGITKQQQITEKEFGAGIRDVIYTDTPSKNAHINEAAKRTMEFVNHIGDEFRQAFGWEEDFLPPRTSVNYLMQNYNIDEIINRPEEFINLVAAGYKQQDERIFQLLTPVGEAQNRLDLLKAAMKEPGWVETRALANEISEARGSLRQERDKLIKALRDDPDNHILLEDRVFLDSAEGKQLETILKPLNDFKKNYEDSRIEMDSLKKKLSGVNSNLEKNLQTKTRDSNLKKIKELEKKLAEQEGKVQELKGKMEDEEFRLQDAAHAGEIPRKFFIKDAESAGIKFRDPNALPKFREIFGSDNARLSHAEAIAETIKGNTPEHLNNMVLGKMFPGAIENPMPLKARTVMLPSKLFNDAGFLDHDIGKAASAYANTMGKQTALKNAFKGNSAAPGIDGMLRSLLQEKKTKEAGILKKPDSPERRKELQKHQKEYNQAVGHMKNFYDAFMGRNNASAKTRATVQAIKNYTAIVRLGGVPITQITDLGAIVLKHTLYPFFMQGLRPMLTSLNGLIKSEEGIALRENAAHANVAIQHLTAGYQSKFSASNEMQEVPIGGRVGSSLEGLSHLSGNFYGTNYIENLNQRMVSNIFQSEVMKAMFDFKAGKMTAKQRTKMASYGIDANEWADRFIENYHGANGWELHGGYQSKYYDWQDADAVNRMSRSIHRAVYDTVVQRGIFTSPLWTNNPILGMLFTFHGWAYSALARYTVPTMQRPDAEAAMGVSVMFGLGLLSEPLRQFANGKEVNMDDDWLLAKGVMNGGFTGPLPDVINTVNAMMHNNLIPGLVTERARELSRWGVLAGPVGGVLNDGWDMMEHGWKGNISQQDVKKGARLIPGAGHLGIRSLLNKIVESSSLPERSSQAEPWPFWQSITGR